MSTNPFKPNFQGAPRAVAQVAPCDTGSVNPEVLTVLGRCWQLAQEHPRLILGPIAIYGAVGLGFSVLRTLAPSLSHSVSLLQSFAVTFLVPATISLFLRVDRGQPATLDRLMDGEHFYRYLGTTLLMSLIFLLGVLCFVLPGLFFLWSMPLLGVVVVDHAESGLSAIQEAMRASRGHRLAMWLTAVVLGLVAAVPTVLSLGWVDVTVPVLCLAWVVWYRAITEG